MHWHGTTGHFHDISSPNLEVLTFPISKNTFCDVINQEMTRDTYKDFHLIRKVKQLLTETGMVGKSYFNLRKRKVSKISAGGRLRENNQALSYLRLQKYIEQKETVCSQLSLPNLNSPRCRYCGETLF